MEQLSLHIEYLLLRHDCVIVPGFGAFIATGRSARLDSINHIVLPPSREIGFNRAVMTDDGLLAHSIARRNEISFEEGRASLLRTVDLLKEQLISDGEVTLGHVGTLTLGEENTIIFSPHRKKDSLAASLGRYSAPMIMKHPAEEENTLASEQITFEGTECVNKGAEINDATSYDKASTDTSESETTHKTHLRDSRYYTFRIRKAYAHIAASIFTVAVAVISFLLPINNGEKSERCLASVVPMDQIANTVSEVTTQKSKEEKTTNEEKQTPVDTPQEKNESIEDAKLPYYLIVATFRTSEEAEIFINSSEDSNIMQCVDGGKLHRVAIAGGREKDKLQARLNDKEIKQRYPGAWIWSSRKNLAE